ncbi:MAG: GMC family oxidoreductase [Ilumatobacteraceae bacterium]
MSEHWVVAGAGSGGCVAAARLSEDPDRVVTLVEPGPDLVPGHVPAAIDGPHFLAALDEPGRVWDDLVVRRHAGAAPAPYARGRGVGGSSAVNALIGLRGDGRQYAGWGWTDADAAWARLAIPIETPAVDELGSVDRTLLSAAPDATPAPLTRAGGRRVTSAEAYLWPARSRPNLDVRTASMVDRVVIDGRRAAGVILADGTEVHADRVVMAAGAIHTPAILLRSGVDTPGVGVGLQDHPSAALTLTLRTRGDHDGLAIGSLLQRGDLQVLPMNHLGSSPDDDGLGLLMVALMRPRGAAGRVTVVSDDPSVHPEVDLELLADPGDRAALRSGVRLLIDLLAQDAFVELADGAAIDQHGTPVGELRDDEAIDRWLLSAAGDYVHASSSCAIGRALDDEGALLGYDGLYVCDASAFPSIPDVNPHLPTTMLAERLVARWLAA